MPEITKPEWQRAKYGSGEHLQLGAVGITIGYEGGSRDGTKPALYYANVFGQRLTKTFEDRGMMKKYAIRTAKVWLANSLIRLELLDADAASSD